VCRHTLTPVCAPPDTNVNKVDSAHARPKPPSVESAPLSPPRHPPSSSTRHPAARHSRVPRVMPAVRHAAPALLHAEPSSRVRVFVSFGSILCFRVGETRLGFGPPGEKGWSPIAPRGRGAHVRRAHSCVPPPSLPLLLLLVARCPLLDDACRLSK
jgi:hypothetical protein